MCGRGFHGSSSSRSTLGARGLYLSKGGMDPRYDAAEKRKPLYRLGASAARFAFGAHCPTPRVTTASPTPLVYRQQ